MLHFDYVTALLVMASLCIGIDVFMIIIIMPCLLFVRHFKCYIMNLPNCETEKFFRLNLLISILVPPTLLS